MIMNQNLALVACFMPLVILWGVLKFAVWASETSKAINHVREESRREHTYLEDAYADVDREDSWDGD